MLASILVAIYGFAFLYAWALTQVRLNPQLILTDSIYKHPNVNDYADRLPLIGFNMVFVLITLIAAGSFMEGIFSFSPSIAWWNIALQAIFFTLMDDSWFYFAHRWMHENQWVFRHIHSIHHRVRSTLPLDYIYVHPFEWMLGGLGIPLACLMVYLTLGSVSAYAFIAFGAFKVFHEINIHSGIKSWVLERHPLKFLGSSEHHGNHHFKVKGNYASCFKWLDHILRSKLS
jgi:sterol desaturase/sphingolipid hydroxylase (fatty acid hydroxylase superfamily)